MYRQVCPLQDYHADFSGKAYLYPTIVKQTLLTGMFTGTEKDGDWMYRFEGAFFWGNEPTLSQWRPVLKCVSKSPEPGEESNWTSLGRHRFRGRSLVDRG